MIGSGILFGEIFNLLIEIGDAWRLVAVAPPLLFTGCMIDPIFQSDTYQLARKLLDASVLRQEAIASNIANAETPAYRRLDVAPDFATELRAKLASGARPSELTSLQPKLAEDTHARSVRPDGNSVEIEHELLEMNRNSVEYDYLTTLVSQNIRQLRTAITGRNT
jgi:flagellar basal-body rod protein FlgB